MKKFLAVFLAMVLCLSVFSALAEAVNPDDIEDNMTSADGKYEIAFVTDVGDLKDKSFNEGTWNGVKLYAHDNGMSYKYYKPANDSAATERSSCAPASCRAPRWKRPRRNIPM